MEKSQLTQDQLPEEIQKWLRDFWIEEKDHYREERVEGRLYFKLSFSNQWVNGRNTKVLNLLVFSQKKLKSGKYGVPYDECVNSNHIFRIADNEDRRIIAELRLGASEETPAAIHNDRLLHWLVSSKRCFINNDKDHSVAYKKTPPKANEAITYGDTIPAKFEWRAIADGSQKLELVTGREDLQYVALDSFWYIDKANNKIGIVETDLPIYQIKALLKAPIIQAQQSHTIKKFFRKNFPSNEIIQPNIMVDNLQPYESLKPVVVFNHTELDGYYTYAHDYYFGRYPTVNLYMDYDGFRVNFTDPAELIYTTKNGKSITYQRNKTQEKAFIKELFNYAFFPPLISSEEYEDLEDDEDFPLFFEEYEHNFRYLVNQLDRYSTAQEYFDYKELMSKRIALAGWAAEFISKEYTDIIETKDFDWYSGFEESTNDFFSLKLGFDLEGDPIDLMPIIIDLLHQYQAHQLLNADNNKKYVVDLENGKRVSIPIKRLKPMIQIITDLFDSKTLKSKSELQVSRANAALILEMQKAQSAAKLRWYGSDKLKQLSRRLKSIDKIRKVSPPKKLNAELRSYQQYGLNWLQFLRSFQLGGVLADDMGLGKTIQTLAHLATEKQAKRLNKPCLIVAPTSLMSNWQNETQKFTPDLSSLIYHGDKRHSLVDSFANYDLIFTTYELILRDKQMFLENEFYYVVLDEAQRIKNVKAKSTQVIMQLKADHRLCLTGTPLENHMGELWSLFHFLMPGFLGDMSTFKTLYKNPIEQYDRDDLKEKLSQRIKPFLLRRLKQDVVEELPPKTEITLPVALTKKQRDVYESIRLTMEKKVRSAISSKGFKRSQIEILEALLRLRQTCCDPRLLKMEDTQDCNSQKLEDLLSLVETLTDENRKILLFSQFTSMLKLIEDELKQRQLSYVKLTGQTKNRTEVIDKFQRGEAQIFLISLKAGGVGLNLTQADTVIHYDPWWNPAVEDQATDRSHRIGQDKPVFVYKLIAKGTVEETIQTLQQKKKKLIDSLFSTQKNAQLKLSEQELKALFQPISSSV